MYKRACKVKLNNLLGTIFYIVNIDGIKYAYGVFDDVFLLVKLNLLDVVEGDFSDLEEKEW